MRGDTETRKIIDCPPGTRYLPRNPNLPRGTQFELLSWTRNGGQVHGHSRDHEGNVFDWSESSRASLEVWLDECEIPL